MSSGTYLDAPLWTVCVCVCVGLGEGRDKWLRLWVVIAGNLVAHSESCISLRFHPQDTLVRRPRAENSSILRCSVVFLDDF